MLINKIKKIKIKPISIFPQALNLFLQEIRFPVIYTVLFMRSPIDFWCKYQIYRGFLSRIY